MNIKTLSLIKSKKTIEALIVSCFPSLTAIKCLIDNIHVPLIFLWMVLGVFVALFLVLLFLLYYRKNTYLQIREKLGTSIIVSIITLVVIATVIGLQSQRRNHLKAEIYSLILSEQEGRFSKDESNRSRGIFDFYVRDYENAAKNLIQHLDCPVEQYYYGLMLYNGIGVQRDEEKGLALIRASADKNFFRAMAFMVNWGKLFDRTDILPYARMLVYAFPSKVGLLKFEDDINSFSEAQYVHYMDVCIQSYNLLYNYYVINQRSYYKVWCLINDFDIALSYINKQNENLFYEESARANAWGIWHLESRFLGKLYMWMNANIRFPNSSYAHFEHALMLLDQPEKKDNNYENISIENVCKRNLIRAEKELDKSLKIAIKKENVPCQYRSLQLLAKILRTSGRENEANRLSIIVSNLKLKEYYDKLVN